MSCGAGHYRPRVCRTQAFRERVVCQNHRSHSRHEPMPAPVPAESNRPARPRFLLPMGGWLIVLGAFLAGLLLFLAIWLSQREARTEQTMIPLPASTRSAQAPGAALPAPQLPGASDGTSDSEAGGVFAMPDARDEPGVQSSPPPSMAEQAPSEQAPSLPPLAQDAGDPVPAADSGPVPIRSPSPRYPRASLRRGESGEVLVQVLVDADGRAREVGISRSSSYPALDQAAVSAVRRWRFQPALQHGRPVAQTIQVPVMFSPQD